MLKAVVFDFDGVIVDSEPLHYAAFRRVVEPMGVQFDYNEYLRRYVGFDDRDGFRAMFEGGAGRGDELAGGASLAELCGRKAAAFEAIVAQGVEPMPGALALIDDVTARVPAAIASGATRRDIDLVLASLGLADRFDAVVSADDVARSKPDPQTYAMTVAQLAQRHPKLDLSPPQCLAIEDTAAGVASARAAGLLTLGLASTGPAESLHHAHRVVEQLTGLTLQRLHEWFDG